MFSFGDSFVTSSSKLRFYDLSKYSFRNISGNALVEFSRNFFYISSEIPPRVTQEVLLSL